MSGGMGGPYFSGSANCKKMIYGSKHHPKHSTWLNTAQTKNQLAAQSNPNYLVLCVLYIVMHK